jgi:hypothetical protein
MLKYIQSFLEWIYWTFLLQKTLFLQKKMPIINCMIIYGSHTNLLIKPTNK